MCKWHGWRPLSAHRTALNGTHTAVLSEDQLGSTPKGSALRHTSTRTRVVRCTNLYHLGTYQHGASSICRGGVFTLCGGFGTFGRKDMGRWNDSEITNKIDPRLVFMEPGLHPKEYTSSFRYKQTDSDALTTTE